MEQTVARARAASEVHDEGAFSALFDSARFGQLQRIAKVFAESNVVPDHYRGKVADCIIACDLAIRAGIHPLAFMQSSYVVHGRPGIESKLAIALTNKAGVLDGRIMFDLSGDGMSRSCTARARDKATGETIQQTVNMQMAKAEGWIDKNGSKWKTLPDLMLQYRSAMFLIRLHCPEVLMGLTSVEELDDMDPEPARQPVVADTGRINLRQQRNGKHKEPEVVSAEPVEPEKPTETVVSAEPSFLDEVRSEVAMSSTEDDLKRVGSWMNKQKTEVGEEVYGQALGIWQLKYKELTGKKKEPVAAK